MLSLNGKCNSKTNSRVPKGSWAKNTLIDFFLIHFKQFLRYERKTYGDTKLSELDFVLFDLYTYYRKAGSVIPK